MPTTRLAPQTTSRLDFRAIVLYAAAALAVAHPIAADEQAPIRPPAPAAHQRAQPDLIGSRLVTLDGEIVQLGVGVDVVQPVALVFFSPECPISNRYVSRLNEIAKLAAESNVQFFGIISDPYVSRQNALEHRQQYKVAFPVVLDATGNLAELLRPDKVPQAFVIGPADEVVYTGRIDDWFSDLGKPRPRVTQHDLADAIVAVSRGDQIEASQTEAIGCIFESWDYGKLPENITYTRHIAPMMSANCVECHRPGEVAPFALLNYQDVSRRAQMVVHVCREGVMPPWRAAAEYGHFRNARRLSAREVAVLDAWAESGTPRGDASEEIPPPTFPGEAWELGTPDLVLTMPEAMHISAAGEDLYRYLVIPTGLTEDKMVRAYQFRPGDPAVVHHAVLYLDESGAARRLDEKHPGPGFPASFDVGTGATAADLLARNEGEDSYQPRIETGLGGWAPGMRSRRLPSGWGSRIKAGSDLVIEIHYHPNGKPANDQSSLALYFADKPVKTVGGLWVGTLDIEIEAGEGEYWRHAWTTLPCDVSLIDSLPHMHTLGKEFRVEATAPDGTVTPLIWIRDWDYRWQDYHIFTQPVHLKRGTRIDAYMRYDNSADNPYNPNSPPQPIKWGWQTTDEMGDVFFTALPADPTDVGKLWFASMMSFARKGALKFR